MNLRRLRLPASWSSRRKRAVYWSAGLLLFYTIFGFLILPLIVRSVAVKQLSKQLDRGVSIQKVKINPYTLSATIRGLLISDPDGQPLVSWDEVYANFQLSSLVTKPWVFKEVSTSAPYVRAEVRKDYTLNFSDLIDKFSKAPKETEPSRPAALRVDLLRIRGARASFTDLTPREPFRRIIGPLELTLTGFHTDPNNKNPYSFAGTTDSGERFSWSGHFYLDPIRSEGELSLDNISLPKYAPLYQDLVRFDIRDGTIHLRSTYRIVKSAATNIVSVTNTSFRLDSFKVAERNSETNIAELVSLLVSRLSADVSTRSAEIGHIRVDSGRLLVQRNKDASINMLELAQPAETATNAPGGILLLLQSVTNAFAMLLQSTNLWSGTIHEIAVTNCALHATDLVNSRPVNLSLDNIWLAAKDISNLPGREMAATLSLNWETNGAIRTDIKAGLQPQHAEVKLALENLTLRPLDPYLEPRVNVLILNSKLGMTGAIRLRRTNDSLPEVTFQGDVHLDDFSSIDGLLTEDLVKWGRLRVSGIDANLNPPVIAVKEVNIDGVSARLIIDTNSQINVMAALRLDKTNAPAEPVKASHGKPTTLLATLAKTNSSAALPVKVSVASIVFTNTDLQFTDRSLRPNVDLTINNLNGVVAGITSDELQRADVNLRGTVEKTGPVEITGKLNPLNQKQPAELKIALKNIDLHPAGPYSGKFVGYRLNKGKLSMDLDYHIEAGKIKSQNLITVDQLMLGEKVESPDALKLPIRLAVAILKDRHGKITLDVPIEGSLDDPQFRLGKVIRMAIVNVLTKIVTSPFAALGAIFGGKGEEISFQDFAPGATELSPASIEKLDALVKGLYERPGLQVEVEGSIDPEADREGLRRQKLLREFQLKKWKSLRRSEQARLSPDQVQLGPEDIEEFTRAAYAVAFSPQAVAARAAQDAGAAPAVTSTRLELAKAEPDATAKGATALVRKSEVVAAGGTGGDLETQLLQLIEVTSDDFERLAATRAKRVKDYIIEKGQIEPERIFLSQSGTTGLTSKGSRVYLHLR